jgi:hypothetical protein
MPYNYNLQSVLRPVRLALARIVNYDSFIVQATVIMILTYNRKTLILISGL